MLHFLFVVVVLLAASCCDIRCDDFEFKEQNKSDWVDPNDMINYDPVTKLMRKARNLQVMLSTISLWCVALVHTCTV